MSATFRYMACIPGANNKASPPGRHREQVPRQRCTFSPAAFSSVHAMCYPAAAWSIRLRAYAMPSVPVPPITLLTDVVARSRLLAAHGARSCLSVRIPCHAQPLTATGAPSQTCTMPCHAMPRRTTSFRISHLLPARWRCSLHGRQASALGSAATIVCHTYLGTQGGNTLSRAWCYQRFTGKHWGFSRFELELFAMLAPPALGFLVDVLFFFCLVQKRLAGLCPVDAGESTTPSNKASKATSIASDHRVVQFSFIQSLVQRRFGHCAKSSTARIHMLYAMVTKRAFTWKRLCLFGAHDEVANEHAENRGSRAW